MLGGVALMAWAVPQQFAGGLGVGDDRSWESEWGFTEVRESGGDMLELTLI